jgi:hypothetical protein
MRVLLVVILIHLVTLPVFCKRSERNRAFAWRSRRKPRPLSRYAGNLPTVSTIPPRRVAIMMAPHELPRKLDGILSQLLANELTILCATRSVGVTLPLPGMMDIK